MCCMNGQILLKQLMGTCLEIPDIVQAAYGVQVSRYIMGSNPNQKEKQMLL